METMKTKYQRAPMPHDDDNSPMQCRRPRTQQRPPNAKERKQQQQQQQQQNERHPDATILEGMSRHDEDDERHENVGSSTQEEQPQKQPQQQIDLLIPANASFLEKGTEMPSYDFLVGIPRFFAKDRGGGSSESRNRSKTSATVAETESTAVERETIPSLVYAFHGEDEISCIGDPTPDEPQPRRKKVFSQSPIVVEEQRQQQQQQQSERRTHDDPCARNESRIRQHFESLHERCNIAERTYMKYIEPSKIQQHFESLQGEEREPTRIALDEKYSSRLERQFASLLSVEDEQQQPATTISMKNEMEMNNIVKFQQSLQELCLIYEKRENQLLDDNSLTGFSPSEILRDYSVPDN